MIKAFILCVGKKELEITRIQGGFKMSGKNSKILTKHQLLNEIVGELCDNTPEFKNYSEYAKLNYAREAYENYLYLLNWLH